MNASEEERKAPRSPSPTRADGKNGPGDPRTKPSTQRSLGLGNHGGYDAKRWLYHTHEDSQRSDEKSRRDDQRITGRKRVYKKDPDRYVATGLYGSDGSPIWGVPKNNDMKLQLAKFSAKETHKGPVTGVNEWVNRFVRQLGRVQVASGCFWPEEVKMDVLEAHLDGKALYYLQIKRDASSGSTLEHVMEALKRNYKCTLPYRKAMVFFDKEKPTYRGYTENYLLRVNAAAGGHFDRNVLMSIVHRCRTDFIREILSKYDRSRTDYNDNATELANSLTSFGTKGTSTSALGGPTATVAM
jgi:hypothetical protein